jgi:hypothetical protein
MELNSNEVAQIVEMLQHADGEDLQDILNQLGMSEQLCKQLMMCEPIANIKYIYEDRLDLEEQLRRKDYWIFESC